MMPPSNLRPFAEAPNGAREARALPGVSPPACAPGALEQTSDVPLVPEPGCSAHAAGVAVLRVTNRRVRAI